MDKSPHDGIDDRIKKRKDLSSKTIFSIWVADKPKLLEKRIIYFQIKLNSDTNQ